MRIGILTIHHAMNYGAVWQAYALSQALRRLGHTVEVIDYQPAIAVRRYRQRLGQRGRLNLVRTLRYRTFCRFVRTRLPLGGARCATTAELAAATRPYDALVAGSDQIWCTGEGSFRGYDPNFFLTFRGDPAVRKLSYAASAGNTKDFAEHTPAVRQALDSFTAISVRDESTAALVAAATGRLPTVVLDPVFLHDFQEIVGTVVPRDELVVFAEQPEGFEALAAELSRRHRLRIVRLRDPGLPPSQSLQIVSPVRWLQQLRRARVVLTDYFHGTALALQFGRPLVVGAPPGKRLKITDLLRRAGLMHLFLDQHPSEAREAVEGALNEPVAFAAAVGRQLEPHRARSRQFLTEALAGASREAVLG